MFPNELVVVSAVNTEQAWGSSCGSLSRGVISLFFLAGKLDLGREVGETLFGSCCRPFEYFGGGDCLFVGV